MTIGEELAEARRRAGFTVTEVSQRTRIREAIIRDIERDNFAGCGGDFYARGDIRAIARAIGADPGPLIQDYDLAHPAQQPVKAAGLLEPATPVRLRERRPPNWTAILGLALVIVLGFAVYLLVTSSGRGPGAGGGAAPNPVSHHRARHGASPSAPATSPPVPLVVVDLTARQDCWVEFTTRDGRYLFQSYVTAGESRRWVFGLAIDLRLGNPAGVTLDVNGENPLPPGVTHPITLALSPSG